MHIKFYFPDELTESKSIQNLLYSLGPDSLDAGACSTWSFCKVSVTNEMFHPTALLVVQCSAVTHQKRP
jgi:hypothetical protein